MVKFFDKYCENIFDPPLLFAHPLLPYLKPPHFLTPSLGIFEVKCDRRNEGRTYGARRQGNISTDILLVGGRTALRTILLVGGRTALRSLYDAQGGLPCAPCCW